MPDLEVIAVLVAKPGSEGTVRDALTVLVPPTREEPGCIAYSLHESVTSPGTFFTVETWKAQSDLDAHMQTPHIAAALGAAGEALAGPPAIHVLNPVDVS